MASWRDVVAQHARKNMVIDKNKRSQLFANTRQREQLDARNLNMLEVSVDSEMLQKSQNAMALAGLAADLQQHRRLQGVPQDVSDAMDKKARAIGKLSATVMKSDNMKILMNSMR